jgi:hypothetical protein
LIQRASSGVSICTESRWICVSEENVGTGDDFHGYCARGRVRDHSALMCDVTSMIGGCFDDAMSVRLKDVVVTTHHTELDIPSLQCNKLASVHH